MINLLGYFVIGKLLIYIWQQFPLPERLEKNNILHKLHVCDLCSGVHIYSLLAYVLGIYLLPFYIPVVSEYITGAVASFAVHVFSIGWKAKFSEVIIVS